jgi:hypothetical protein
MQRKTTRGLVKGTPVRVRRTHGTVIKLVRGKTVLTPGENGKLHGSLLPEQLVEYRDERTGGIYTAKLADVRINRSKLRQNVGLVALQWSLDRKGSVAYRGHTIVREDGGGVYALLTGVPGYRVRGPHCNGGSQSVTGARSLVDRAIEKAEQRKKSERGPRELRRLLSIPVK